MAASESAQQVQLDRMRLLALALLLSMGLVSASAHAFERASALWPWIGAFSEAAMVGGLADWFAVTALFRHPMGLPIPHTAIIPNNKERIGESIGEFLQNNFMTREVVRAELHQVDFASSAAHWLADPQHAGMVARQVAQALPTMAGAVDDAGARDAAERVLGGAAASVHLSTVLARLLNMLVEGGQHHVLLERILGIVARALDQHRPFIRQKVHAQSPRWLPRAIDDKLFERILEGVQSILLEIQGEDSEWRARFDEAVADMLNKLPHSPEVEERLQALLARSIRHARFRDYAAEVWQTLRGRLRDDVTRDDSVIATHIARALQALAGALESDPALRARVNGAIRSVVSETIVERRDLITSVIWRVIRGWDAHTVSRKFELQVGKDLQYIRINGTVVGGLIGLLLHAFSAVLPA